MSRSKKVAAAAFGAGSLLLGTGFAAALEATDQRDPSVAEENTADRGADARDDANATAAEHRQNTGDDVEADEVEAEAVETDDVEAEGEGERPTDTHGFTVSQLATTTAAEGRAKGEEISAAARSNGANGSAGASAGRSADARAGRP